MNTILVLLVLTAVSALLVAYARHDRFAGPASTSHPLDELGPVEERFHLVPRGGRDGSRAAQCGA